MNHTELDEVVRRCNEGNMTREDLEMSVCTIANYLREGSTVGKSKHSVGSKVSIEGKEYIKDEIERVEDFITRKLDVVDKRFIKVEEIVRVNQKQSELFNEETNRKLLI